MRGRDPLRASQPNPHRLSRHISYHALRAADAAFETSAGLPPALRRATPKRQREFLAGRRCAAAALRHLGAGSTQVAVAADRAPIWPEGVVGSITHAGGFAAAAVAWAVDIAGLGIDSEEIIDPATACDIAAICMVDEARLFRPADGRSFCEFCTFVFSAKEAVFKCLFPITRRFLEFGDVGITSLDWEGEDFAWTAVSGESGVGRLSRADGFIHTSVEMPPLPMNG